MLLSDEMDMYHTTIMHEEGRKSIVLENVYYVITYMCVCPAWMEFIDAGI